MDSIDRKILAVLQSDSSGSIADLAERAGVSQTPCWRRIKKLEETGVIERRVALLNPEKLGLGLTVFVLIRAAHHDEDWLARFSEKTAEFPEIQEIHRMTGDIDYLLKLVVRDVDDYDRIYKKLIRSVDLSDVSASFSMECIKSTTALPLTID